MEKPRIITDLSPAALSVNKEAQLRNAGCFMDAYLDRLRTPFPLVNHVGVLTFESDPFDVEERQAGLAEYLYQDPPKPSQWIWGRTLIAEVVGQQLIHSVLSHALNASSMYVDLVPTSIDASSRKDEAPYQKGVDICMLQIQDYQGSSVPAPICGVDVTLGKPDLVKSKRKKPGIQCPTAMPAIVIPLTPLTYGGRKMKSFAQYLDDNARREILEKGTYSSFYGLDEQDVTCWKDIIRSELRRGLVKCREGLEKNSDHPALAEYPYMEDVMEKIHLTNDLVEGTPIPLKSS